MDGDRRDEADAAAEPLTAEIVEPVEERSPAAKAKRVQTAITPIIDAESVHIPTPAWGVAVREDVETIEGELVETGEAPAIAATEPASGIAARRWPGWSSLALAIATAVVQGVAVSADAARQPELATVLAWIAIGTSIVAMVGGIAAAILDRGRITGVFAAVVGVFANPWILLQVLTLLRG